MLFQSVRSRTSKHTQLTAPIGPDIDPGMFAEAAVRLFQEMDPKRRPREEVGFAV